MACCRGEAAWRKRRPYWRGNAASRCGKRIGICKARVRSDVRCQFANRRCRRHSKFLATYSRNCVRILGVVFCSCCLLLSSSYRFFLLLYFGADYLAFSSSEYLAAVCLEFAF